MKPYNAVKSSGGVAPKVSVVMPVYNTEKFLAEAVDSVLRQGFPDLELVAVDDGSSDASLSILKSYAEVDSRIKIVSRPNTGIVGALNDGLQVAQGSYIARLDADDVATSAWLRLLSEHLNSRLDCVIVSSGAMQIDHAGRVLGAMPQAEDHETIMSQLLTGRGSAIIHSGCMFRSSTAVAVGGYAANSAPAEDLDFFLRLAEHGRVAHLPQPLVHLRRHVDSSTALSDQKRAHELKISILRGAYARRSMQFDPSNMRLINHPASEAEAFAVWVLLAFRSREWRTGIHYLGRTALALLRSPTALCSMIKRLVFAVIPNVLRRLVASWRRGSKHPTELV